MSHSSSNCAFWCIHNKKSLSMHHFLFHGYSTLYEGEGSLDLLSLISFSSRLPFPYQESHSGCRGWQAWHFLSCSFILRRSPSLGYVDLCMSYHATRPCCFHHRWCRRCFPAMSISGWYLVMCHCAISDCGAYSFSYLSLNCSYSDFFIFDFSGRSKYTYFFRRKVSASRILQVPDTLFLGFFQKLFAVCASQ